jgi:ABC-type transport system involved in multi-copper enzyme maturation permease subunit
MSRDLLVGPGIPIVALTALVTLTLTSAQVQTNLAGGLEALLVGALDLTGWILTLLATAGIVSADRAGGIHRTIFAHPVSPPLYYLQRWLLGGALVVVAVAVAGGALVARLQAPALWPGIVARAALVYLLFGGLVLLCSTLVRRDWLTSLGVLAAHGVLALMVSAPVARLLDWILPPAGLLMPGRDLPTGADLLFVVAYGCALVVAALVLLARRPLSSGARE